MARKLTVAMLATVTVMWAWKIHIPQRSHSDAIDKRNESTEQDFVHAFANKSPSIRPRARSYTQIVRFKLEL